MMWFILVAIYILILVRYVAKIKSSSGPDQKEETETPKGSELPVRQCILANRRGEKYRLVEYGEEAEKKQYRLFLLHRKEERLVREYRDKTFQEARDEIIFSG